jgi:Cu+-exporting ATPase
MATVKDPVCGMEIDPATAAGSEEYKGKIFHFCSQSCLDSFKSDPQKYAA